MALVVLDESDVGISKAPNNGFVIQLKEIVGLPEGMKILIPFEGESAGEVFEAIGEALGRSAGGPKIEVATPHEMEQEANHHGFNTAE